VSFRYKILLFLLVLCFLLPWIITAYAESGVIGMYTELPDVILSNDSDIYDCLWHFWWSSFSLDNGLDPRSYGGLTLAWHNMGWPDLFISYITGFGYNFILFLGSLFAGFAGYLLAREWGLGKPGALLSGFIIIWMPVRLIRMYQHYPIASIGFVLLTLFFIKRYFSTEKKVYFIWIFLFSGLAVTESLYHGFTIAVSWVISFFLSKKVKPSLFWKAGIIAGAGCIIGSLWLFTSPNAFTVSPEKDWKEAVYWAAEPQSFFLPSFLGKPLLFDYMPNKFEGVVSPGLIVAILALYYCFLKKSWKSLLVVLGIILLSWGPLLKFRGIPTPVPLPFMVLAKLPWLSAARAPSRFAIITGIMAAIAAGAFIEKRKSKVFWLLTGLIIVEITPFKLNSIETTVPDFYSQRANPGLTLEIPASDRFRRYSLFEIADSSERIVKYLARNGEIQMSAVPQSLWWESQTKPTVEELFESGAETIIYNRWMFPDSIQNYYDSLYSNVFIDQFQGDSVWVWESR